MSSSSPPSCYAIPFTGYLIRGLPTGTKGEPTDFTITVEDTGTGLAILHTAERIDSKEKYLRVQRLLREMGFTRAVAKRRNGQKKIYDL